jgi:hypothetical protein
MLQKAADPVEHIADQKGLEQVVLRTQAERLDHRLDRGVGGHQQHHGLGVQLADGLEHRQPAGAGHPEVTQDHIDIDFREAPERGRAVGRLADLIPFLP